jgi:hypothetical protein
MRYCCGTGYENPGIAGEKKVTTCLCLPSSTVDIAKVLVGIVIIIAIGIALYWKRKSLLDWLKEEKTPLWFIAVMISYSIPAGILIAIFPTFGAMVWETLNIHVEPSWIVIEGLKWSAFLDVALIVWVNITLKIDYIFPWLERRKRK